MVITLLIACLVLILAVAAGAVIWIQDTKADIERSVQEFITAPDPAKPSPFAQLVVLSLSTAIPDLANAVAMSLKAQLMGQASGIARGAKAIEMGLQAEMISDNPMAQVAAGLFEKQIKRNPMLGLGLQQLMANMANKAGSPGGTPAAAGGSGNHRPAGFNFKY